MGVLVHMHSRFDPMKRSVHQLARPTSVRRLVRKHRALRPHTRVYRPGGVYGRRKVREFAQPTVCLLNGAPVLRKDWAHTIVGPSDIVAFCSPPHGGGNVLASIVMVIAAIAITIAAPYLGPIVGGFIFGLEGAAAAGTLAAAVGTAVVAVSLSAAAYGLASLFSQPPPPTAGAGYAGATPASSPTYNLTAQGNYARLQAAIPEAFGRNRMFPDFVTTPYASFDDVAAVTNSSTDEFLHHIVGLGIGEFELEADSLKIGDTPITSYPDIEWAVIEPDALGDPAIADERWITAPDLADIELLDAAEGSPYAGPYPANPAQTLIGTIAVDMAAPRGLWAYNPVSTGLDGRAVTFEVEAQLIDDGGTAIGDPDVWETFAPISFLRTSQDPQRVTAQLSLPSNGRWQVRLRRTDAKDTSLQAGHQLDWIGLRGRIVGRRRFHGMTCIQLKMKAGAALNAAQSRQFNVVATRKLETWDGASGAMGTARAATRSACDAFAYIALTSNGGRLSEKQVALAALYANEADFAASGWTFDFIFDGATTVSEGLARVARAVVGERVVQGGRLQLVRDVPAVAPIAMFSQRNIAPASLGIRYMMTDSTSPDCIIGTYIDQITWKPRDITVAFDDSKQERPTRMTLYGVGTRDQGRAVLWNLARGDRYRRRVLSWSSPLEGMACTFGDGVSFSYDIPNYGQTLEVIDFDDSDPTAPIFTFVDRPFIGGGEVHYAAVRDSRAQKAGPFVATAVAGEPFKLSLAVPSPADLPEILIGGDKERTWLQLGNGEAYAKPLKIKQVTPRDALTADIIAYDDDPRMYEPLPDEPDVPIGAPTDPLVIPIHTADGPVVNLRTLANDNDYSGLAIQPVTFTLAAGVEVAIVRGSWPAGAVPILQLAGILSGGDGAPGAGGGNSLGNGAGLPGGAGGSGGTALDATTGALVLSGAGTIRAGKGGGGGGGGGADAVGLVGDIFFAVNGGMGGAGNGGAGLPGSGAGGATSGDGGNGGAQGDYATAGAPGLPGGPSFGSIGGDRDGGAGGAGGFAGQAIAGLGNIDLAGFTGTIIGATV